MKNLLPLTSLLKYYISTSLEMLPHFYIRGVMSALGRYPASFFRLEARFQSFGGRSYPCLQYRKSFFLFSFVVLCNSLSLVFYCVISAVTTSLFVILFMYRGLLFEWSPLFPPSRITYTSWGCQYAIHNEPCCKWTESCLMLFIK
jgi:hypothetical protein